MSDSPVLAALAELPATLTRRLDETNGRLKATAARLEHTEGAHEKIRGKFTGRVDRLPLMPSLLRWR